MTPNNKQLKDAGLKITSPRIKILQYLQMPECQHISAEELYKKLLDQGDEIGLATVYRVLNQFDDAGIVTRHLDAAQSFEVTFWRSLANALALLLALSWLRGCAFWAGKPFYPQDIASALAAVPQPRLLVTTPFHLSALLASGIDLPAIDLLLSATAPLSTPLAADAEARTGAPLLEIYGSTESGQLASRRTTTAAQASRASSAFWPKCSPTHFSKAVSSSLGS